MTDKKPTYPMLSDRSWWTLREKFKNVVPRAGVTPTYLSTALGNMEPKSANVNVIRPLRLLGLIDSDNKPTERAMRWRDDSQYANVCDEILNDVCPQELVDVLPPPSPERERVVQWFANHTGSGAAAAGKMASTYLLVASADVNGAAKPREPKQRPQRTPTAKQPKVGTKVQDGTRGSNETDLPKQEGKQSGQGMTPSLHIDLQIHIHPEATADQIETVFASMSKYLYNRNADE